MGTDRRTKPKAIYSEYLKHPKWIERTFDIKERDDFCCQHCHTYLHRLPKGCPLDVHHIQYIPGRMPWEYTDDLLITLCRKCHSAVHVAQNIGGGF